MTERIENIIQWEGQEFATCSDDLLYVVIREAYEDPVCVWKVFYEVEEGETWDYKLGRRYDKFCYVRSRRGPKEDYPEDYL